MSSSSMWQLLCVLLQLAGEQALETSGVTTGCGRSVEAANRNSRESLARSRRKRIVGGMNAVIQSWPWHVRILDHENKYKCGGTLINSNVVLTAAHCLEAGLPLTVVAGVTNLQLQQHLSGNSQNEPGQAHPPVIYDVARIQIHERFNATERPPWNDVGLIFLRESVKLSSSVGLVCMPEADKTSEGSSRLEDCVILGWGGTRRNAYSWPKVLQQANVRILDSRVCNDSQHYDGQLKENEMLCAGVEDGSVDACEGDSGGPLLCKSEQTNQWLQLGIISYGRECASRRYPGIYVNVTNYLTWIDTHSSIAL